MNIRLRELLENERVPYQRRVHGTAYTAQEVAAEEHIPGKIVAKTVIIKADDQLALAVLPGSARMDLARLKTALGAKEVCLATELEFTGLFPDCEVGAMPPFGNLYGIPVYVEISLTNDEEIVFNAGTHEETVRIKYADFERLARPRVLEFAVNRAA